MLYNRTVKSKVAFGASSVLVLLAGGALSAAEVGCGGFSGAPVPEAQVLAENGTDIADIASQVAAISASFASGEESKHLKLSTLRATTGPFYAPNECLKSIPEKNGEEDMVSIGFESCDGPWGLSSLSGTLGVQQGDPALAFSAAKFHIGGAEVTFDAQANLTSSEGVDRVMTWTATNLEGKTARGREFRSSVDFTLRWQLGGTCITVEGQSSGNVSGSLVSTQVKDLIQCDAACPASGSIQIWPAESAPPPPANAIAFPFTGMDVVYVPVPGGSNLIHLSCDL
jgi:hypothetical protein